MQYYTTLILAILLSSYAPFLYAQNDVIDPNDITIARDKWGTPHIFAKTDAAVAYGLAWANAEDAFETMQELLIIGKQMMGKKDGIKGAPFDFFVHSIGTEMTYQENIGKISKEYMTYLDGYCQGVNAYAKANPDKILLKKAFPIEPKDILKAYLVGFSALSGAVDKVTHIMEGDYDKEPASKPAGSNAYAFAPHKTTNGNTFLCINPHFKIEGAFSFYDAHLHSEEGLNITGALFQGGTCVFMGNNEHLGWGKTFNHIDQVDVFELEMHPRKKLYYKYDEEYIKLEKRPVWLKVRIGKIVIPVRKMTYWSKFGPTYKSPQKKYYAVRCPAFFNLKAGEQYYRMNKATNYDEFQAALSMNAHSMFNLVYGDKDGNILYLCNGMLPKRNPDYDFTQILKGDSKEKLWTEYYTQKELPRVENPNCGYVFNANNTPTNATCVIGDNCSKEVLKYADMRSGDNNRSTRFMEMMNQDKTYTFEEFKALKFDTKMTPNSKFWESLSGLFAINSEEYPPFEEAINLLQNWDGDASAENTTAPLFLLTIQYVFDKMGYTDVPFTTGIPDTIPAQLYIEAIENASKDLLQQHGRLKVPLKDILFHRRNGKLYPASGFPDVLSPIYTVREEDGKQVAEYADTYIHFVEFDKKGPVQIQTLLPFEVTKASEQYEDELEMFNERELKTMSLNKKEVLEKAVKTYHPVP
ncbi:penicillin acylase family protein [Aureispira sp. CCB-QB1]|uniref:penicillin acylase family protein n=1 Tax=Aureispira sp. CCB-QB1 TaxID=1313421 RepID=UPI0006985BFE|nr:penicillin acylase family protein [Aureispira sp. CCB-QB1]